MSFTATLGMVREMVPQAQRTAAADRLRLYRQLLADIGARPLAPRANRTNSSVVKRKMSNFGVKGRTIDTGHSRRSHFARSRPPY